MTYRCLGDYIREVNVRNRELKVAKLVGLTIDKAFIPSVANVIGTDLSNYKVIRREQFACSLMQVSRDGKMPVAMFEEGEAIMSPAYPMFEVVDKTKLLPQYLMMWFSRSEFDREASYYAVGGVRGSLTWEDFCNMQLPVPSIERQREIVSEYETLTRRIRLNEQMIEKLEATAQALYRHTFVDNIDKQNLPQGWRMGNLYELCDSILGGDWGKDEPIDNYTTEVYCVRGADIPIVSRGNTHSMPRRYILPKNLINRKLKDGNIVIEISGGTPTQSTGRAFYVSDHFLRYISKDLICSNFCKLIIVKKHYDTFLYASLKRFYNKGLMFRYENSSNGINNLDLESLLREEQIPIPTIDSLISFSNYYKDILNQIILYGMENEKINDLQSLLLARMGQ